jgi:hypothetical protein
MSKDLLFCAYCFQYIFVSAGCFYWRWDDTWWLFFTCYCIDRKKGDIFEDVTLKQLITTGNSNAFDAVLLHQRRRHFSSRMSRLSTRCLIFFSWLQKRQISRHEWTWEKPKTREKISQLYKEKWEYTEYTKTSKLNQGRERNRDIHIVRVIYVR